MDRSASRNWREDRQTVKLAWMGMAGKGRAKTPLPPLPPSPIYKLYASVSPITVAVATESHMVIKQV